MYDSDENEDIMLFYSKVELGKEQEITVEVKIVPFMINDNPHLILLVNDINQSDSIKE